MLLIVATEELTKTTKTPGEKVVKDIKRATRKQYLDLSRFDAAPLIAFIATKETNYGNETDGRIPH